MHLRARLSRVIAALATAAVLCGSVDNSQAQEAAQVKPTAVRDLNTPHMPTIPASKAEWEARRKRLRTQLLASCGLVPMPDKTPLNPRITGKHEFPDYSVENVALETMPGFYLCGNLYKPKGKPGRHPAIVNPHGHWANGRLEMEADVPKAPPAPGKRGAGKGHLVSIGVNLARQGFVVFAYDMVGYNDTMQASHSYAGSLHHWLWGVSLAGLQTWNSIRVVDYLSSLTDVDATKIGCTGASGGGSQAFILAAIDDRIKVSVPVNMISSTMQGGCLCENGPGLRVGTDNVEIGAMTAPRPQLLVACTGDWTVQNPTVEWPAIKKIYDLYGAGDKTAVAQFNYDHNYNIESREAMYAFFGKWLMGDSDAEHFREKPVVARVNEMRVWSGTSRVPAKALDEDALTAAMKAEGAKQIATLWPKSATDLRRFQETIRPALGAVLHFDDATQGAVEFTKSTKLRRAVLVVTMTGEGAPFMLDSEAALAKRGVFLEKLEIPSSSKSAGDLWKSYFSGYNQTPVGESVQRIGAALKDMRTVGYERIDLVGLGSAGLPTILARGLAGGTGRCLVDWADFDSRDDSRYLRSLYAPGLRRVGDLRSAAMLIAPQPLCMFNTGDDPSALEIAEGYGAVGAPLKLQKGGLTPQQIIGWLTAPSTR